MKNELKRGLCLLAALAAGCTTDPAPKSTKTPTPITVVPVATLALGNQAPRSPGCVPTAVGEMIREVNTYRMSLGLLPLAPSDELNRVACERATMLGVTNVFTHQVGSEFAKDTFERMSKQGWSHLGENIAAGQARVSEAQEGFRNSDTHDRTMRDPVHTHIGTAQYLDPADEANVYVPGKGNQNGPYYNYHVQLYAKFEDEQGCPIGALVVGDGVSPVAAGSVFQVHLNTGDEVIRGPVAYQYGEYILALGQGEANFQAVDGSDQTVTASYTIDSSAPECRSRVATTRVAIAAQ